MHLFNIFWPVPPWRWLSQGQAVGGGRRLFLACSSGRCNQGATKVQPRCSQVLRLFSFSSTLLSEKLFWHGWSGMICFLITNVIVNLWSALLTCETWLRPTNTLWRLSQEGRWTRRATGQLSRISNIWNNRSQGILSHRFKYYPGMFPTCSIWLPSTTKLSPNLANSSWSTAQISPLCRTSRWKEWISLKKTNWFQDLWEQFEEMDDGALMLMARDLSPHYMVDQPKFRLREAIKRNIILTFAHFTFKRILKRINFSRLSWLIIEGGTLEQI